ESTRWYVVISACVALIRLFFFFSSRRRHTRLVSDWSSDVCSSDLSPQRRRWPESTGPESSSKRRDYVPRLPRPSCRSSRPPEPRQALPNQRVCCQSYRLSFLSPRPPRLNMFELLKNFYSCAVADPSSSC